MPTVIQLLGTAALGLLLLSCGRPDAASENATEDTVATTDAPSGTAGTGAADPPAVAETRMLPFDMKNIPSGYEYEGDPIGGARWNDQNGEHTVIVSMSFTPTEHGTTQNIFGYHYLSAEGPPRRLWKIQDFAENWCDKGDGLVSEIAVKDLNGDGIAESAFVYNVQGSCDVSPREFKLMLHSGEKKYALRGTNTVMASQEPGTKPDGGEKRFDPAFDSAPAEFRAFASEMWDRYVK